MNDNATVSIFKHEESARFFKDGVFQNDAFAQFRHENILTTTGIGTKDSDNKKEYSLWLGFYSPQTGETIQLNSVSFSNGEQMLEASFGESFELKQDFKGLKEVEIRVLDGIDEDFFDDHDEFFVQSIFTVDGERITQNFTIIRKRILIPIR
jgi:hypothetical protein